MHGVLRVIRYLISYLRAARQYHPRPFRVGAGVSSVYNLFYLTCQVKCAYNLSQVNLQILPLASRGPKASPKSRKLKTIIEILNKRFNSKKKHQSKAMGIKSKILNTDFPKKKRIAHSYPPFPPNEIKIL